MSPENRFLQRIDKQIVAQIILVILFLVLCFWIAVQPNPFEVAQVPHPPAAGPASPPNPTQEAMRATAMQSELEENRDQTVGILLGGSALVILVIGGTLLVMNRK
jgi:hypothetical protein